MSEQENTQVVQSGYADFAKGDIQSLLQKFSEDADWFSPGPVGNPLAIRRRGRGEVGEHFRLLSELVEFSAFEPKEFISQGDKVVVLGRYAGKVRANGNNFESEWAMVFTLRGGKIAKFREYNDTANWTAAFGLK